MLILRIGQGVIDHFPVRRSEWLNSFVMIGIGAVLAWEGLPQTGLWQYLGLSLADLGWSFLLMMVGFIRLIVLSVNGTFPASWYGPYAAHVRILISLISALVWLQLVFAGVRSPMWSPGVAAYTGYFLSDALNTLSASAEAREIDRGRKNVASGVLEPQQPAYDGGDGGWFSRWRRGRLRKEQLAQAKPG